MKTHVFLWAALCMVLISCSGSHSNQFTLLGEIENSEDASMVYLQQFRNKMYFVVDSAKVVNGKFTFKGEVGDPALYAFSLNKKLSSFFIEPGKHHAIYNPENPLVQIDESEANELYSKHLSSAQTGTLDIDSLIEVYPKSEVPLYLLYRYYSYNTTPEKLRVSQNKTDNTLSNRYFNLQISTIIEHLEQVEPGKQAPDFSLPDTLNREISLSSLQGKYVLLEFWASWCPYCRKESPVLTDAFKQFSEENFTILSVSLDCKHDAWLNAIHHDGLEKWQHVSELTMWDSKVAELYAVRAIPSNFLIDPNGIILAKNLEGEALIDALNHLLKE